MIGYETAMFRRDSRSFIWQPKDDITAYELALAMPLVAGKWHDPASIYDRMPPEVQRHFGVQQS